MKKIKSNNRKPRRIANTRTWIVLAVFSLLLPFYGLVGADYVMPAPPQKIVTTETSISVSLTTPTRTVFINVTEYDARQIVKNVTVEFLEPVTYVGFALEVLSDRPFYTGIPRNETVLQYYIIRFLTDFADEITNVTMFFAIEKAASQEKNENVTLMLYRYDGRKNEEILVEKTEDDTFSYFKTTTEGSAYIAITRAIVPTFWWPVVVIIALAALITVIGICDYRRFRLTKLRKTVET